MKLVFSLLISFSSYIVTSTHFRTVLNLHTKKL